MDALTRNRYEREYREWRQDHEEVYRLFERFALEMFRAGRRFGIRMLTERVRWEVRTTWAQDSKGYKINNNHGAYIIRDLIAAFPVLEPLVVLRAIKTDDAL